MADKHQNVCSYRSKTYDSVKSLTQDLHATEYWEDIQDEADWKSFCIVQDKARFFLPSILCKQLCWQPAADVRNSKSTHSHGRRSEYDNTICQTFFQRDSQDIEPKLLCMDIRFFYTYEKHPYTSDSQETYMSDFQESSSLRVLVSKEFLGYSFIYTMNLSHL